MNELLTLPALAAASVAMAVGAVLQGTIGFGSMLLAAPILVLIDPRFAPAAVLLNGLALSILMAARERTHIDLRGVVWILGGRIPGTLIGAGALVALSSRATGLLFGLLVLAAVGLSAVAKRFRPTRGAFLAAGFVSGIMATTTAIGGPPVALVLQHSRADRLRGTLSGYFVFSTSMSLIILAPIGRLGIEELRLALVLLPGTLLGFALSSYTTSWIDHKYTRPAVLGLSAAAALLILFRELF